MGDRRSEFLAEHKRRPNAEEEREILRLEREDRRQEEAERHVRNLRRAYLAQPGTDEAGWEREKGSILAQDRADQTVKNKAAASRAQSGLYRSF